MKGVPERGSCVDFDPMSLEEVFEAQWFDDRVMVGACPSCGSESTVSCEGDPAIEDPTVGHCLECDAYWCTECRIILKEPFKCGHWSICGACSKENGYLSPDEFFDRICPTCEYWNGECTLGDFEECEYMDGYRCPYEPDIYECPKISAFAGMCQAKGTPK
ncbi:MAG: hypothetical protein ACUVUE_07185 [Candidatus Bathycorpusculaceae bacterium]